MYNRKPCANISSLTKEVKMKHTGVRALTTLWEEDETLYEDSYKQPISISSLAVKANMRFPQKRVLNTLWEEDESSFEDSCQPTVSHQLSLLFTFESLKSIEEIEWLEQKLSPSDIWKHKKVEWIPLTHREMLDLEEFEHLEQAFAFEQCRVNNSLDDKAIGELTYLERQSLSYQTTCCMTNCINMSGIFPLSKHEDKKEQTENHHQQCVNDEQLEEVISHNQPETVDVEAMFHKFFEDSWLLDCSTSTPKKYSKNTKTIDLSGDSLFTIHTCFHTIDELSYYSEDSWLIDYSSSPDKVLKSSSPNILSEDEGFYDGP